MEEVNAAARYAALLTERNQVVRRAEDSAMLSIPALFPPEGYKGSDKLYTPYQGVGSRGVNNLASKLLLSLFPPNASFFKLNVDELTAEKVTEQKGAKAEIDASLGAIERKARSEMEGSTVRVSLFETLKQLIVAGNCCPYFESINSVRVFHLDKYVVQRAPDGTPLLGIIKEQLSTEQLPDDVREMIMGADGKPKLPSDAPAKLPSQDPKDASTKPHDLYTVIKFLNGGYVRHQEINGMKVQGTDATYPKDKMPYLFLRFTKVDGEDYGRGYVEEIYGDLYTLEELSKSMVDVAALMSRVVHFRRPAASTDLDDFVNALNGDVIEGNVDDIGTHKVDKYPDIQYVKALADDIEQRLSFAFLMNTSIQRGGERVTAEEIRFMARELEDVLGGVYSVLSHEFQRPFATILLDTLASTNSIPKIPKEVNLRIVTGVEALGRGQDLANLDALFAGIPPIIQKQVERYTNVPQYLTLRANALNMETNGLIRSREEVQAELAQEQQAALAAPALKAGTDLAKAAGAQSSQGNPNVQV